MSKTLITLRMFQLAVSADDYEPDGAPYSTEAQAEAEAMDMARERVEGRFDLDDLRRMVEDGEIDTDKAPEAINGLDDLSDEAVMGLAEQRINWSHSVYPVDIKVELAVVEAAIEAAGITTDDRDDLEEGLAAAYWTVQSWEKGDLAGAVHGLEGWYEGVIERLPNLACSPDDGDDEDEGDDDHEDELQAADEEAALAAKGITPEVFNDSLPTTFIFTYGDGSLGDIRDKGAERYATLESIRAVPGMRRAIIAEVQLLDEATGHYKVIKCHARH